MPQTTRLGVMPPNPQAPAYQSAKPVIDLGNSSHVHKIYTMRHWEDKRNPAPLVPLV